MVEILLEFRGRQFDEVGNPTANDEESRCVGRLKIRGGSRSGNANAGKRGLPGSAGSSASILLAHGCFPSRRLEASDSAAASYGVC
jgi:hypothetical protein